MSFSFEAGDAPPAAPVEYLRYYHRIDPRLEKHLPSPVGTFMACEEHFDDEFVATNPFYQDYLIPMGARYLYGTKLLDDPDSVILIGHISKTGRTPMNVEEKSAFARLSEHFRKALDIQKILERKAGHLTVGAELLEKLRQPMILIDYQRRISYRNRSATALLADRDFVMEVDGTLACRDADSDLQLTIALRDLGLVPTSTHGDQQLADRRSIRLRAKDEGRSAAATLIALRPESTLGSFGLAPQALFTLFEPGASIEVDPFLLSVTFDLTPAEARLAVKLVNGRTPEQCARDLNVKISTVRSHLISIYSKTGASGQADLVRMVLSASAL